MKFYTSYTQQNELYSYEQMDLQKLPQPQIKLR